MPHTEIGTYFTKADGQTYEMYPVQGWMRIKLRLETAGPVVVGTEQHLGPILAGHGELLPTGAWVDFYLDFGSRLYVASSTVNRIGFIREQIPYAGISDITKGLLSAFGAKLPNPVRQVAAKAKKVVKPLVRPDGPVFMRRKGR